jgi:hypothetical protein
MLLLDYGINDVDVEIRQSKVIQSAGPQLFRPTDDTTPWAGGTANSFLDEGSDSKRLLLGTVRHVVLPKFENKLNERKSESQCRHEVLVFSEESFQQHLVFIKGQIEMQDAISSHKRIEKRAGYYAHSCYDDSPMFSGHSQLTFLSPPFLITCN